MVNVQRETPLGVNLVSASLPRWPSNITLLMLREAITRETVAQSARLTRHSRWPSRGKPPMRCARLTSESKEKRTPSLSRERSAKRRTRRPRLPREAATPVRRIATALRCPHSTRLRIRFPRARTPCASRERCLDIRALRPHRHRPFSQRPPGWRDSGRPWRRPCGPGVVLLVHANRERESWRHPLLLRYPGLRAPHGDR